MEWLINDDPFIVPDPGIFAGSNRQIPLLGVVVVDLKEKIPCLSFPDQEGVSHKLGRHIGHVLRPE